MRDGLQVDEMPAAPHQLQCTIMQMVQERLCCRPLEQSASAGFGIGEL